MIEMEGKHSMDNAFPSGETFDSPSPREMAGAGGDFDGDDGGYASPPPSRQVPTARQLQSPRSRMASRLQSTATSYFPLGSNDDELERARARAAARARRMSIVAAPVADPASHGDGGGRGNMLDHDQIMDLFHNCIKLASENKINQKNTWELNLIDHLREVIRAQEPQDDDKTNFQKASCTLEAGVKIYSMRVDSLHSEAYKVLAGINRAGRGEDGKEKMGEGDHANTRQGDDNSKKEIERKTSPLSTLESSFETLNLKKIDAAFVVDPLYHQTSAQFDEGGAKSLLLNNLGVYGGCRVLFDFSENPEKSMLLETESHKPEVIDLSFVKEYIEKMMTHVPAANDITPTLREILNHFDEDNCRPSDVNFSTVIPDDNEDHFENNHVGMDDNVFDYICGESCNYEHDDQTCVIDDCSVDTIQIHTNQQEENFEYMFNGPVVDGKFEKVVDFLSLGLRLTSKSNDWAGPDHWKYRKIRGTEKTVPATEPEVPENRSKNKGSPDLEFMKSLYNEIPDIFAPPKNPKSLLLPANKVVKNIILPEDCHYRPKSLVRLFLLPHLLCIGKKGRKLSDESREEHASSSPFQTLHNDSIANDQFDDGNVHSDIEDQGSRLESQPRQVNKVEIKYEKVSKQVDVHVLKDVLWSHIQESISSSTEECEAKVSLKQVLRHFPDDCPAALSTDISPHLFFICLLHLANEHCLSLDGRPGLDELDIHIPSSALVK